MFWSLGRVKKLHRGADGRVRVVTVKTQRALIVRAVTELCVLPVLTTDQE